MELMLVQAPLGLVVNEGTSSRVRCTPNAVDGTVIVEQVVKKSLRSREDLLRKLVDEVLGKLLQLRLV